MNMSFFTWEVVWQSILTLDQLRRKSWSITNRYCMCKEKEELGWSYAFSLFQSENIMIFFSIWSGLSGLGVALLCKRSSLDLTWLFRREEEEESLESRSFVPILEYMERKKQEVFWKCRIVGSNNQIFLYMYLFGLEKSVHRWFFYDHARLCRLFALLFACLLLHFVYIHVYFGVCALFFLVLLIYLFVCLSTRER